MNQQGIFKKWLWAGVMGILTILLCLIVSDDLLGLNSPPARSQMGHYVFWVSLIGLPLLFYKFVSWRYTLLNIPLYFLLYFPKIFSGERKLQGRVTERQFGDIVNMRPEDQIFLLIYC